MNKTYGIYNESEKCFIDFELDECQAWDYVQTYRQNNPDDKFSVYAYGDQYENEYNDLPEGM